MSVTENGKTVTKRMPADRGGTRRDDDLHPQFENTGDETATNVVVNDPIPEGTAYVTGSATETGEVTFSIDGGKTFKKPSLLTYEVTNPDGSKEKRTASPEQYTHVRWQLPAIPAGEKGEVSFRVQVKQ